MVLALRMQALLQRVDSYAVGLVRQLHMLGLQHEPDSGLLHISNSIQEGVDARQHKPEATAAQHWSRGTQPC